MAKRAVKSKAKPAIAADDSSSSDELPGWIAGYPPWTANIFLQACGAKSRDEGIRLLCAKRAIDDGNRADFKRLLREGLDPNSEFPHDDGSLLHYALFNRPNATICELLLDAGANTKDPGLVFPARQPGFESVLNRLLDAGADPNNHRGGQSPLVGMGIDTDATSVIAFKRMLETGVDVNGTATIYPNNKHGVHNCTALMTAAWRGNLPVVTALLEVGADTSLRDSSGNTALDWARSGKSKKHAAVIELLETAGATAGRGADLGVVEIPDFRKAAKAPTYKKCVAEIQKLAGSKPVKVELEDDDVPGASAFMIAEGVGREIVDERQDEFRSRGAFIFISHDVTNSNGTCIVVLPTSDPYEAVAAIQTNGINSGVTTAALIGWLKKLEKKQPFVLQEIGPDLIRGQFTSAIKDPLKLLKQIYKLCPDVDMGDELTAAKAKKWAAKRSLYLWWH
jgi:ankyrin repeat protein